MDTVEPKDAGDWYVDSILEEALKAAASDTSKEQ